MKQSNFLWLLKLEVFKNFQDETEQPANLAGTQEIKGANKNGGVTLEREDTRVLPSHALLISRVISEFLSLGPGVPNFGLTLGYLNPALAILRSLDGVRC